MGSKPSRSGTKAANIMLVSTIAVSTCAAAATAQPSEETMAKARKWGLTNATKGQMPDWVQVPNMHLSQSAPANFPVDAYRSNVLRTNFANSTKGAPSATLSVETRDSPATVNQFYLGALRSKSFVVQLPKAEALAKLGPPGSVFFMQGTRSKERVAVNISATKTGTTYVSVSWATTY